MDNLPIGFSTCLERDQNGDFYIRKKRILKEDGFTLLERENMNVFKEHKSLYEGDSEILEKQKFSLENGLLLPKIALMLGISKEATNQTKDRTLIYLFDYKYVLASYEIEYKNYKELWERTTDDFKTAIKYLEDKSEELLFYNFIDEYGTHLITKCDIGYRFRKLFKTEKNETETVKDFELDSNLKVMEYFNMNNEYTSQKMTNYNVSSKESETLILGHKKNVMTAIKGLDFDWNMETTEDAEVIDIHPLQYIPLYDLVLNPTVKTTLKKVIDEREYELAMGWNKGRNYCCAYLETDPGFFMGDFALDIELDENIVGGSDKKHRIVITSSKQQKHKIEFLDQKQRPTTFSIYCTRWGKVANKTTSVRIYYRDDTTYMATIREIYGRKNERLKYTLNWEPVYIDNVINEDPRDRGVPFGI